MAVSPGLRECEENMPSAVIKAWSKRYKKLPEKKLEKKWDEAGQAAAKQGKEKNWAYRQSILNKMTQKYKKPGPLKEEVAPISPETKRHELRKFVQTNKAKLTPVQMKTTMKNAGHTLEKGAEKASIPTWHQLKHANLSTPEGTKELKHLVHGGFETAEKIMHFVH